MVVESGADSHLTRSEWSAAFQAAGAAASSRRVRDGRQDAARPAGKMPALHREDSERQSSSSIVVAAPFVSHHIAADVLLPAPAFLFHSSRVMTLIGSSFFAARTLLAVGSSFAARPSHSDDFFPISFSTSSAS